MWGRKGGETAEKAGDEEEPQFRRQARMTAEPGHGEPDQQAAQQVGRQGPQGQGGKERIQAQTQAPTQQGAQTGAGEDGKDGNHVRRSP